MREGEEVDQATTKALRKRIREADDIIAVLRDIAKDYQFRLDSQWSDDS